MLRGTLIVIVINYCSRWLEGDACNRDHDNSPGICRKVEQCPKVRQDYNAGISLTICAYINRKPIVCCPTSVQQQDNNKPQNSNENISLQSEF